MEKKKQKKKQEPLREMSKEEILERLDALEIMLEEDETKLSRESELWNGFKVVVVGDKIPAIWCNECDNPAAGS